MAYRERLLDRQSTTGRPVRVGLVGAGQMGRGFVAQVRKIAGMEVVAVADIDVQRATSALKAAGIENVVDGRRPRQAHQRGRGRWHRGGQRLHPADGPARRHGHRRHRRARDRGADRAAGPAQRQARRPAQRGDRHHRRLAARPHRRPVRRGLHPVPGRRAGRDAQARRVRPRPRLRRRLRGQGQEQPVAAARHPDQPDRRGHQQEDEPEDAVQLRRRLQSHDRDGGAGQRRRPRRQQARDERPQDHRPRAARRVQALGRRRHPRPQRRGRLRHRPGRAGRLRRRPQRRAHRGRGDGLPRHGRRARTTPSTGPTTWPASRRRCPSRPRSSTGSATSTRAPGAPRSPPARSDRSRRARPSTASAASASTA